jgi:C-terminal processing protease CtpA/Prc
VRSVDKKGKAAAAGWKPGDEIVSVEGEPVKNRWEAFGKLQGGGPKKTVRIKREDEELDTVLDFTGGEGEEERARRQKVRAEKFGEPKTEPEATK